MEEKAPLLGGSQGAAHYAGTSGQFSPQGASAQGGISYSQIAGAPHVGSGGHVPDSTAPSAETTVLLPPPANDQVAQGPPPTRADIKSAAIINEQDARDAIIQHASEHCCYGKAPAVGMQFTDMVSSSAFHYTLETFAEGRATKRTSQPYRGEGLVVTGPPPGPWDIQAQPPQVFKTSSMDIEIPNTASVEPCDNCGARGFKTCFQCLGTGKTKCSSCHGTGRDHHHGHGDHHHGHGDHHHGHGEHHHGHCSSCQHGLITCISCTGSGQHVCYKCQGRGNLRVFVLLTVTWTNHVEDHIVERTALPSALIRDVRGQTVFEETNTRVWPINHFPEQEINAASSSLVSKHGSQFTTERILMQRHNLRIVPVTQVFYSYKNQNSAFFVYGDEHKVHAPDYPAKCCCGCTVL